MGECSESTWGFSGCGYTGLGYREYSGYDRSGAASFKPLKLLNYWSMGRGYL